jgi:adenylate cyclase
VSAGIPDMVTTLLPVIEHLQAYVWRRHLSAAADRIMLAPPGELAAATMTVGFADIVRYTKAARHSDVEDLAAPIEAFEEDTSAAVVSNRGQVVKMVGDKVLFVTGQPGDAAEIALRLTAPDRDRKGLPALRVGMAAGRVLTRFGDVYGPVVNLAARLTSLAKPGTALVDAELAAALRRKGGTGCSTGGPRPCAATTTSGPGPCARGDSGSSRRPAPVTVRSSAPNPPRSAAMLVQREGSACHR